MAIRSHVFANSTAIASASWDTETRQMTIVFKSGRSYTTSEAVPEEVYDDFTNAPSPGQDFNQNIKGRF